MSDQTEQLTDRIKQAIDSKTALQVCGGNTKSFYGREPVGEKLETGGHSGVVNYEPTELIITARAGTPLKEIESTLAENGQMLPFEPPAFGEAATLGGTIACNFSGPRRPYAGSARDYVLGSRLINGNGEVLHFGGEVMKNVAGYDVSRLQCGALGTLGLLLEVSLKILPQPEAELTLVQECNETEGIETMNRLGGQPYPLSAAAYDGNKLYLRLSGSEGGVSAAQQRIGGDVDDDGASFWQKLKEHTLPFFEGDETLWRMSLAPATAPLSLQGRSFIDWGGAQRWLRSSEPAEHIRKTVSRAGGHATEFRHGKRQQPFQPLAPGLLQLHRRLKQSFDPHGIFNRGRMFEEI